MTTHTYLGMPLEEATQWAADNKAYLASALCERIHMLEFALRTIADFDCYCTETREGGVCQTCIAKEALR